MKNRSQSPREYPRCDVIWVGENERPEDISFLDAVNAAPGVHAEFRDGALRVEILDRAAADACGLALAPLVEAELRRRREGFRR